MTISFHHYRGVGTTYILGTGCAIEKRIDFDDFGMRYDIDFLDFGIRKGRGRREHIKLGGETLRGHLFLNPISTGRFFTHFALSGAFFAPLFFSETIRDNNKTYSYCSLDN